MKFTTVLLFLMLPMAAARACDLCAVYRVGDAQGESNSGFLLSVAEQFIPHQTPQLNGDEVQPFVSEHLNSSITHLVAGYNISPRFGLSVNVPITHLTFRREDIRYSLTAPPENYTEDGHETGLGDVSLVGRVTLFQKKTPIASVFINALVGVKFPTGDDDRLDAEIEQTRIYDTFPGDHDDPLEHSFTAVHQHKLALGSGSFDGIFGLTVNANWQRWFFNGQFQYYLRTEGDSGFEFGDELIVSGGPGFLLLRNRDTSVALQANTVYDWMGRDSVLGRVSNSTGQTAWYLGPLVTFNWGGGFSANVGVDVPLEIRNRGYDAVPDYRLHGGVSWTF
jgi:hypothetical protein